MLIILENILHKLKVQKMFYDGGCFSCLMYHAESSCHTLSYTSHHSRKQWNAGKYSHTHTHTTNHAFVSVIRLRKPTITLYSTHIGTHTILCRHYTLSLHPICSVGLKHCPLQARKLLECRRRHMHTSYTHTHTHHTMDNLKKQLTHQYSNFSNHICT